MPKPNYADVMIDVEPGRKKIDAKPEPDSPFHVLIVGDFSGRTSRGVSEPLVGRRPVMVDVDEIETLPVRLQAEVRLPLGEDAELRFPMRHLDDLHPDHIYENCELFAAMRAMRRRLEKPETLKAVTEEILGGLARETPQEAKASSSIITGSLLDQIAEESEAPSAAPGKRRKPADPLLAYVQDLIAQHLVPGEDPKQKELIAQLDADVSAEMRRILHNPLFQRFEAAWRSLDYLVRNVETNTQLKIFVLDVSMAELLADLATAPDLRKTGLYELLVAKPANGEPWALIGLDRYFRPWIDDVEMLVRIAMIADQAGAPLLAGADPLVVGVKDPEQLPEYRDWETDNPVWKELRSMPEARRIGLAMPRFLLRLPYGKDSSPAERFRFEEMPEGSTHGNYLWGNPMYGAVTLVAQAFTESKWRMRPGEFQRLSGLPMHWWREDGEYRLKPCAEVLFTQEAAERLIALGLMPLLSLRDTDTAMIGMFQSIADPATPLEGRWS
jgi:type VI secretion system protein ImpC